MIGKIHSFESMGAVDGPGLRFVIFLQGCPMRCAYCHNPDSWDMTKGKSYTVEECVNEIKKYQNYFNTDGGVTISGGEPLCQIDFVTELFKQMKKNDINTCLDTSGIIFDKTDRKLVEKFITLINYTDLVLLDIKHINNEKHTQLTGKSNKNILSFSTFLSDNKIPVWIRYVLVPTINDDKDTLLQTKKFINTLNNVKKVEVLPYHTMGMYKYKDLGIEYRLKDVTPPSESQIELAEKILEIKNNQ